MADDGSAKEKKNKKISEMTQEELDYYIDSLLEIKVGEKLQNRLSVINEIPYIKIGLDQLKKWKVERDLLEIRKSSIWMEHAVKMIGENKVVSLVDLKRLYPSLSKGGINDRFRLYCEKFGILQFKMLSEGTPILYVMNYDPRIGKLHYYWNTELRDPKKMGIDWKKTTFSASDREFIKQFIRNNVWGRYGIIIEGLGLFYMSRRRVRSHQKGGEL